MQTFKFKLKWLIKILQARVSQSGVREVGRESVQGMPTSAYRERINKK